MGRRRVGGPQRLDLPRSEGNHKPRRYRSNAGSFDKNSTNLAAGAGTRFKRRYALPGAGDRFGELTVIRCFRERRGACDFDLAEVRCSCGASPHIVFPYNLRKGKSTSCPVCAKKRSGYGRKRYFGYADICPDESHRRRLLNRIAACIGRCHRPRDQSYPNYGGRGISVFETWRTDRRAFLRHLVSLEGWDRQELDLDRIDVNQGYEPGNLRFVTRRENCGNKRTIRELEAEILRLKARIRSLERGAAE